MTHFQYSSTIIFCCCLRCRVTGHERAGDLWYKWRSSVELAWEGSSLLESEMSTWKLRWSTLQNQSVIL